MKQLKINIFTRLKIDYKLYLQRFLINSKHLYFITIKNIMKLYFLFHFYILKFHFLNH